MLQYLDGHLSVRGASIPMVNSLIVQRFPRDELLDLCVWGRFHYDESLQSLGTPGLHGVVMRPQSDASACFSGIFFFTP